MAVLFLSGAKPVEAWPLAGDLNADCTVYTRDLAFFADQWLDPSDGCSKPNCADIDGVDGVNMVDFALLAVNWKKTDAPLIISEFLASNAKRHPAQEGDLLDEQGDTSDWIEIYNPTGTTINLEGWYLTDDVNDKPTRWEFPAVEIEAGKFVVVFASGKDKAVAGSELHTDFKLDADDVEDVALVAPNGSTVAYKYAPYAKQLTNISYGVAQYARTLVASGATASYYVPAIEDAGADWTAVDFNDSDWDTARTPLSFSATPELSGGDIGNPAVAGSYSVDGDVYTVKGSGEDIWRESDSFHYVYVPLTGDGEISARVVGMTDTNAWAKVGVMIRETLDAGSKNVLCYMTPDHGKSFQNRTQTNQGSYHSNSEGYSTPHWVRLVRQGDKFYAYHSDDGETWVLHPASSGTDNPVTISMAQTVYIGLAVTSHSDGQICTAIFEDVTFGGEVTSDLAGKMLGINASLRTRIKFELEAGEPEIFETLTLRARYEDGFAAYLNGEKVARGNDPDPLRWNSAATIDRPIEDASAFDSINIMAYRHLLRAGTNVLAIQALNDHKDNQEFLIVAELSAAGGVGTRQYFTTLTPNAHNVSGAKGSVDEVSFSLKRGFYDSPFQLRLSTETDGAQIRYTLDGSAPSITHGNIYNALSPPTISTTATIRAAAVKAGWLDSPVKTHTYLMNLSEAFQSLPVISIVGDEQQSLYLPNGVTAYPKMRGMEYERPVSVEFIKPEDNSGFQSNCGIRVQGSDVHRRKYPLGNGDDWTRNYDKYSFKFYFRSMYDDSGRLDYPMFEHSDISRYRSVALRGGHNDVSNPFIKDELIRRLHKDMGAFDELSGRIANVFINGEYKHYYNPCERTDEEFLQEYNNSSYDWDVISITAYVGGAYILTARNGDMVAWDAMIDYARNTDLSVGVHYEEFSRRLDLRRFADYLILELYSGNWDWPNNNWVAARERSPEGTFRFYTWDTEGAMSSGNLGKVAFNVFPGWAGNSGLNGEETPIAWLYRAVRANSNFRQLFADRLYKHFYNGGALIEARIQSRFSELRAEMSGVLPGMSTSILNTWIPSRTEIFFDACIFEGMFTFGGPTFNVNDGYRHGGRISPDDRISLVNSDFVSYLDVELVAPGAPVRVHVPVDNSLGLAWTDRTFTPDSTWTDGSTGTGVGYENSSGYEELIDTNVLDEMRGISSSVFTRIEFNLGQSPEFDKLELYMRYDDGFVAYLNGPEVCRSTNVTNDTPGSADAGGHEAGSSFDKFDITAYQNLLVVGTNVLAIHGINASKTSSDMLVLPKLLGRVVEYDSNDIPIWYTTDGSDPRTQTGTIGPTAIEYTDPFKLTESRDVKARALDAGKWSALNEATFAIGPVAESLRITEIMFHPEDTADPNDPNEEYVELKNVGGQAINVNLVRFTNGIDFTFGDLELPPGGLVVAVKDRAAFDAQYPAYSGLIAGEYSGSLDNGGERIEVEDAAGQTIHNFRYGDDWRLIADGDGFSLTIINPANPDPNSWGEKDSWRASAYPGGSPGSDDSGIVPDPGAIAINEVLAHSHSTAPDWIELYNTTAAQIDIGGWYLSDSASDLKKYKIADGRKIDPYSYVLFYEDTNFGLLSADPGRLVGFAFSENGDVVYLSSGEAGVLMGYREAEDFGASPTGISFGRYFKRSTGNYNFVMMDHNTSGSPNAYPEVGPIVINEIMYNPQSGDQGEEYIELRNIGSAAETLYDLAAGEPWRFTNAITYVFPPYPGIEIAAGGYILLAKDPDVFKAKYGNPPVELLGPYDGKLSNGGEKLELSKPGDIDEYGRRYYIRADRVNYSDGSGHDSAPGGIDLWPTEPDGGGKSLTRKVGTQYGNDPNNWTPAAPSPGL